MVGTVQIIFHPFNRVIRVERGTTILDAIRLADLQIESICGGKGECRKCKVILTKGVFPSIPSTAQKGLSANEIELGYVLACQVQIDSDCEITIPVESRIDFPKILLETSITTGELYPGTAVYAMTFAPDEYMPFSGGSIRMPDYTGPRPTVNPSMYRDITECKDSCTVTVSWTNRYPEIVRLEKQRTASPNYGVAIDLGTTTIVALLVDLSTGSVVARASTLNKQITYGEELVTRMAFAHQKEGLKKLQVAAIESITAVLRRLVKDAGVPIDGINDVCLGGNTVMNHLLTGKDPTYLEMADAQVSHRPIVCKAGDLGLPLNPEIYFYILPNVSRYVGGDAIGDVLSSGLHTSSEISLLIDLGTNGEIILGTKEWLASASCASGPAFEGSGITHGMRAMRGAIEHVIINPVTREAQVSTIDGQTPKGICGSGIIDSVSEMFRTNVLDFAGKIVPNGPQVREGKDGLEYLLVPTEKTQIGRDIVITQRDLAYIMDSKAALLGAIGVLMKKYKVTVKDVTNVYLAGAFGTYVNTKNLTDFGMIPRFPKAMFHFLGNGCLTGTLSTLLSMKKREEAETIAERMVYLDLLIDADFIEEYTAALYIPGKKEYFEG